MKCCVIGERNFEIRYYVGNDRMCKPSIYCNLAFQYGFSYCVRGCLFHEVRGAEACSITDEMRYGLAFYEHDVYVHSLVESRVYSAVSDSKPIWSRAYKLTVVTGLDDILQLLELFAVTASCPAFSSKLYSFPVDGWQNCLESFRSWDTV